MAMEKSFTVESIKAYGEAGSGQFEAVVSVFGNIDHVRDRVKQGAFARAVKDQLPPPVVWSHHWAVPPIGETIEWGEAQKGLSVKGALFVGADDKHQYADMVYAAMKSRDGRPPALREFSFSYEIPEGGQEDVTESADGKTIVVHDLKELYPIHEVGPCLRGCNPATEMIHAPKSYADGMVRLERLAVKLGKTVDELLDEYELEHEGTPSVRMGAYPAEVAGLLTAVPGH